MMYLHRPSNQTKLGLSKFRPVEDECSFLHNEWIEIISQLYFFSSANIWKDDLVQTCYCINFRGSYLTFPNSHLSQYLSEWCWTLNREKVFSVQKMKNANISKKISQMTIKLNCLNRIGTQLSYSTHMDIISVNVLNAHYVKV